MAYRSQPSPPVTLLWHDYETTGLDKARDRPMQFAGIRTDVNLEIVEEPIMEYCKLGPDILPDPGACLLTGISPLKCNTQGLAEADFARLIQSELGRPGTCGVGYNTIRFDDEFTRHLFYRTMRDPYRREWANGNSRWDILDLVRAVHAFNPSVMAWPTNDEGQVSFRLELLAEANGLPKMRAHDALSDVETTIALARLLRDKAPELYHHYFGLRLKKNVLPMFDMVGQKPLFHVSALHGLDRGCVAPVIPLATHPDQANVVIVFDLAADPTPLIGLPAEEIADRVFRAEPGERLPLTTIYANRSPMLLTTEQARLFGVERPGIGFDKEACSRNWKALRQVAGEVASKVQAVYSQNPRNYVDEDPELCLYGGFASREDGSRMLRLEGLSGDALAHARREVKFDNPAYDELLFRHVARNWPQELSEEEASRWRAHVQDRLVTGGAIQGRSFEHFEKLMADWQSSPEHQDNPILAELRQWADDLRQTWAQAPNSPTPRV